MKFWLYYFLKATVGIPFRVFARHIYLDGLHNIPEGKPVLIVSNHSNSFLDGVVIKYFLKRRVYTMVRGDMFRKPPAGKLLRSMRLLPIFRSRDAKANVAREGNNSTLEECYDLFEKNRVILIFSEGDSNPAKELRKFKTGSAAMAFDMWDRGIDLYVVPCGINYSKFFPEKGSIHLAFGPAIHLTEFFGQKTEDRRKEIIRLTDVMYSSVSDLVIKSKGHRKVEDFAQDMALCDKTEPMFFVQKERGAHQAVQFVEHSNKKVRKYKKALKQAGLSDRNVAGNGFDLSAVLLALFTFAASFPAYLVYLGLWRLSARFTNKKVKSPVFKDSIYFGMGVLSTYVVILLVLIVAFSIWNVIWALIFSIAAIWGMTAWFSLISELPLMYRELKYWTLSDKNRRKLNKKRKKCFKVLKESVS